MKKNVIVFGLIVGTLLTGMMLYSTVRCYNDPYCETNDVLGYAGLLAIFSLIFVAIKNFRDKYNSGFITFGSAFKTGAYISLIASTIYVGVWLVDYYIFIPDFMDKYAIHVLHQASQDGATQPELDQKAKEIADFRDMYKNPLFVILISYAEILPLGLIISVISAALLRRKPKPAF
jgi:hypothetical protein